MADIFRQAAELNEHDERRRHNVVALHGGCEIIVAGDLHGHRSNLNRIIAHADLAAREGRCLVLQEIVHAPPDARTGHDRSIEPLLRAARLKIAYPRQVVFLLANHDVAQATGNEITKAGAGVCDAFNKGVQFACGADATEVLEAIRQFLLSAPIAVRTPGGVLIAHTLPSPKRMELAGEAIPPDPYRDEDFRRGGKVYEWTWGRSHTAEQIDHLAERLGVQYFVLAHKHLTTGHEILSPRAIILASDHDRGSILQFSSDEALTEETAVQRLRDIARLK